MEKTQKIVKAFAIILLLLVIANCVFAFADSTSTAFIQIMLIAVFAAIIITTIFITKDVKSSLPVLGVGFLYSANLVIRGIIYILNALVNFFNGLALSNINNQIHYGELSGDALIAATKTQSEISKRIAYDTFGKIMDFVCIFVAIAVIVFAIMTIISLIRNKKFNKTLVGKFSARLIGLKDENASAKKSEKTVESDEATTAPTDENLDETSIDEENDASASVDSIPNE